MIKFSGVQLTGLVTRRRIRNYAAIMLIVPVATWIFSLATGTGYVDRFGQVKGTDFLEFYAAGKLVASGHGAELYAFTPPFRFPVQFATESAVVGSQLVDPTFAYVVPPYFALPFVPLSALPYLDAYFLWLVGNVAVFFATFRLLRAHVPILQGRDRRLVLLVAASFFPLLECFFDGQNSIVTFFLFAATYVLLRRKQDIFAGIVLGLVLYKPQLVMILALFFLATGRWRALLALAGTGLTLIGVSWVVVGSQGLRDYVALSLTMPGWVYIPGWRTWNMHSLTSFFILILTDPWLSRALTAVTSLAVIGSALVVWRTARGREFGEYDLQYAIAILATVLVSPHVFAYDLTVLILPGLLLVNAIVAGTLSVSSTRGQWLLGLIALGYVNPLFSRFAAITLGLQVSVPVLIAIFAVTCACYLDDINATIAASDVVLAARR